MKYKVFCIFAFAAIAATLSLMVSCSDDDDPTPYEPILWGGTKEVIFAIDGIEVDSAFCANSSVYSDEDGKTVQVSLCKGDTVSFLLPPPNTCEDCITLESKNGDEVVYSRSYQSVVNLNGESLTILSHFTLHAIKGYYSSDWEMDNIVYKGKTHEPLRKKSIFSGYVFHLRKTTSGYEIIDD